MQEKLRKEQLGRTQTIVVLKLFSSAIFLRALYWRTQTIVVLKHGCIRLPYEKARRTQTIVVLKQNFLIFFFWKIKDEPKQSLYWNFSASIIVDISLETNPNNRCIETLAHCMGRSKLYGRTQTIVVLKPISYKSKLHLWSDEPKQSLYWNASATFLYCSSIPDEPKQSLYWNFVFVPLRVIFILDEPKQSLYWNHLVQLPLLPLPKDEPKQSLYWNPFLR